MRCGSSCVLLASALVAVSVRDVSAKCTASQVTFEAQASSKGVSLQILDAKTNKSIGWLGTTKIDMPIDTKVAAGSTLAGGGNMSYVKELCLPRNVDCFAANVSVGSSAAMWRLVHKPTQFSVGTNFRDQYMTFGDKCPCSQTSHRLVMSSSNGQGWSGNSLSISAVKMSSISTVTPVVTVSATHGLIVYGGHGDFTGVTHGSPVIDHNDDDADGAMLFSGSGDLLTLLGPNQGVKLKGEWTLDCNVRGDFQAGQEYVLTSGFGENMVMFDATQNTLGSSFGGKFVSAGVAKTVFSKTKFTRLTVVGSSSNTSFYVDGVFAGSHSTGFSKSLAHFYGIGGQSGKSSNWLEVSQLAIWERALKPSEMKGATLYPSPEEWVPSASGLTITGGSGIVHSLCLPVAPCYTVVVAGGSHSRTVSWKLVQAGNNNQTVLAGGAPYNSHFGASCKTTPSSRNCSATGASAVKTVFFDTASKLPQFTSFEEPIALLTPNPVYADASKGDTNHTLANKPGYNPVQYKPSAAKDELGFTTTYWRTTQSSKCGLGSGKGYDCGLTQPKRVGVIGDSTFSSSGSDTLAPHGHQFFVLGDTDGFVFVTIDPVDASEANKVDVHGWARLAVASWESKDSVRLWASVPGSTDVQLNVDSHASTMKQGTWEKHMKTIAGAKVIVMKFGVESDSKEEEAEFDYFSVSKEITTPSHVTLKGDSHVTSHGLQFDGSGDTAEISSATLNSDYAKDSAFSLAIWVSKEACSAQSTESLYSHSSAVNGKTDFSKNFVSLEALCQAQEPRTDCTPDARGVTCAKSTLSGPVFRYAARDGTGALVAFDFAFPSTVWAHVVITSSPYAYETFVDGVRVLEYQYGIPTADSTSNLACSGVVSDCYASPGALANPGMGAIVPGTQARLGGRVDSAALGSFRGAIGSVNVYPVALSSLEATCAYAKELPAVLVLGPIVNECNDGFTLEVASSAASTWSKSSVQLTITDDKPLTCISRCATGYQCCDHTYTGANKGADRCVASHLTCSQPPARLAFSAC